MPTHLLHYHWIFWTRQSTQVCDEGRFRWLWLYDEVFYELCWIFLLSWISGVCFHSLLQALVVQVGQGVRDFRGCQAHHLVLVVQDFPWEKREDYFLDVTVTNSTKKLRPIWFHNNPEMKNCNSPVQEVSTIAHRSTGKFLLNNNNTYHL